MNGLTQHRPSRRISCLFYTHPWAIRAIRASTFGLDESLLLVEIAEKPVLGAVFDLHKRLRRGVAGLLHSPTAIDDLCDTLPDVKYRVMFAAHPAVSVPAMAGGVGVLPYVDMPERDVILLVNLSEYSAFTAVYPYCSKFHFMWDVADPQSYLLPEAAKLLTRIQVMRRDTWGGFFWYADPGRPSADAVERLGMLKALARAPSLALPS